MRSVKTLRDAAVPGRLVARAQGGRPGFRVLRPACFRGDFSTARHQILTPSLRLAPQTRCVCADGDGEATSVFEETLGAAAALQESLAEERTLLSHYKAIAWGRVLTPIQVWPVELLFLVQRETFLVQREN